MGAVFNLQQQLEHCGECCVCGIPIVMPAALNKRFLENRTLQFYCPSGHSQHYTGKTALEKANEEATRLRTQLIDAQRKLAEEQRRVAAAKGMNSLREDGAEKVLSGQTTIEEVLRVTQEDLI